MHRQKFVTILLGAAGAAILAAGAAVAHPNHGGASGPPDNGAGHDPDGDSNPAVDTRLIARIGDAAEAALDPPFEIITFEAPRSSHGEEIKSEKVDGRTVKFSNGLHRQLCDGQLYFRYDTQCTYMAAPSGKFAAVYRDEWGRPLSIRFEEPVCGAALALYPTGGQEDETFEIKLQPYADDGAKLTAATYKFDWTKDTFRWRLMAAAFFLEQKATRLDVNIKSVDNKDNIVRFLIDDVAFVESDCSVAMQDIQAEAVDVVDALPAETEDAAQATDEISGS